MANENKKSNWKAIYVAVLLVVTIACVGVGIAIHIMGAFSKDGKIVEKTYIPEGKIDKIQVDVDITDLELVYGESYIITYKFPENKSPEFSVKDGKLSVIDKRRKVSFNVTNGFGITSDSYKMIIQVPYETKLEDINLNVELGSIQITDISSKALEIKAECGSVECNQVTIDDATIKAELGSIEVDKSIVKSGDIKAECGSVELDGDFEKLKVKCEIGSIDITSDKSSDDMDLDLDAKLGSITVNGKEWK